MFIRPMIGRSLDSMFVMEEFLEKECQDLDYTIVRPPRLMNEPMIGKQRIEKRETFSIVDIFRLLLLLLLFSFFYRKTSESM